VLKNIILVYQ